MFAAAVYFIACHGGPADHFATFAEELTRSGYEVEVYGSGPALTKFTERNIAALPFDAENPADAEWLATLAHEKASAVITDVGHIFNITLQDTLGKRGSEVLRLAYYDNPESSVPGDYSIIAEKVMSLADKTLFANSHLATDSEKNVGLGYYPVDAAKRLAERRKQEHDKMRAEFFASRNIEDRGQKVAVYFGGCNDTYFNNAFPAFLNSLSEVDLSSTIVILHQHPRAKLSNQDALQFKAWAEKCPSLTSLSSYTSDEAQIIADVALYYQTSMGPGFALAGIPTIQVGHIPYRDVLVRGNLALVATDSESLSHALATAKPPENEKAVLEGLGLKENWPETLKKACEKKRAL